MLVKGVVSAIDLEAKTIAVILPEYDNIVTRPLKAYGEDIVSTLKVNDLVLVAVFNNDFNDCMIIMPFTTNASSTDSGDSITLKDRTTGTEYEVYVNNGKLTMEVDQ